MRTNDTNTEVAFLDHKAVPETQTEKLHQRLTKFAVYRWFFAALLWVANFTGFRGRGLVVAVPYLWLFIFFFCPFLIVLKISLSEPAIAQPPYLPILESLGEGAYNLKLSFYNFLTIFEDNYYIGAYLNSVKIAVISTLFTLIIGFAMAYAMVKSPKHWRGVLLMLVILPFWSSFLIRVYALVGILKDQGLLNGLLMKIGIISEPLTILNTEIAVYIGITYSYLPFMILPIYANLEKLDWTLLEAAADLGASKFTAFWQVIIPLSKAGIFAGCFLVFIPAVGEFVIPDILGGSDTIMIGKILWIEFFNNTDWPMASAVAVVMLLTLVVPIVLYQRTEEKTK